MLEENSQLEKNLQNLTEQIKKSNSFKSTFLRGIVLGVGSAIGASVVAGIVIATLIKVYNWLQYINRQS